MNINRVKNIIVYNAWGIPEWAEMHRTEQQKRVPLKMMAPSLPLYLYTTRYHAHADTQ